MDTEQLWQLYHQRLKYFIQQRVPYDDSDDILQEVFIKIDRRLSTLNDHTRLESWLYQITRHAIIDYYRIQKKPPIELPDYDALTQEEEHRLHEELSSCLQPMIQDLPDPYRETITLYEIEGLDIKTIAEQLSLSTSGVKSRLQRGREQLRLRLLQCCEFEQDAHNRLIDFTPKQSTCNRC